MLAGWFTCRAKQQRSASKAYVIPSITSLTSVV